MQLLLNQTISESPPDHCVFLAGFKSGQEVEVNPTFSLFSSWRHLKPLEGGFFLSN